jgi:hypothetical protein
MLFQSGFSFTIHRTAAFVISDESLRFSLSRILLLWHFDCIVKIMFSFLLISFLLYPLPSRLKISNSRGLKSETLRSHSSVRTWYMLPRYLFRDRPAEEKFTAHHCFQWRLLFVRSLRFGDIPPGSRLVGSLVV